ncbi:hypothetical protein AB6A40_009193 [Gnathostoma spinigerum]|uniref:Uncharacterized protein n=1 Tax=Gnathostoma spinigerum TaxID=75299 RepID=A0ABD6ER91_9BILA
MPLLGEKSRFAVLKIEDDTDSSDDEGSKEKTSISAGKKKTLSKHKGKSQSPESGLLVHVVQQKPKPKGKKAKKQTGQVVDPDGFIVQDATQDYYERKYREDLQEAVRLSQQSASVTPPPPASKKNGRIKAETNKKAAAPPNDETPAKVTEAGPLKQYDDKVNAIIRAGGPPTFERERQLMDIYRSALEEKIKELSCQSDKLSCAENDVKKYKSRYQKICELLKDAEVNEKVHLKVELEKSREVEQELSGQIGELRGELMQAKTRIRELEEWLEKLKKT